MYFIIRKNKNNSGTFKLWLNLQKQKKIVFYSNEKEKIIKNTNLKHLFQYIR